MGNDDTHERFTRLLIANEPAILRHIMIVVPNRADARDVFQECSVAMWRNFAEYDSNQPFLNWAMGFARIELRRFLSRAHRRAQLTQRAAELLWAANAEHRDQLDARESHLRTCLEALPLEHRDLIDGYYRDQLSAVEIAGRLGKNVEAVYKSLQRIRLALHRCVETRDRGLGS